jgi:hypothetical protein
MFLWVNGTPFGRPVVPEVCKNKATSSWSYVTEVFFGRVSYNGSKGPIGAIEMTG